MALAIASSFTPYGAHAQEIDKKSKDSERLKEVEVVGTSPLPGIGIEEDKLPYDVQSINAEALYRSQSMNLTDFMSRNLSGVNINEVQGSPFQADITYRGFRLSGILGSPQGLSVYLDGVRVNEPFGDVINWDMIPEAAINNVTLVPGSNPIYGLNTLGGALAFTTKSGLTAPGTEVKLQAGSFGRMRADVAYGSKSDDGYHSFISATGFREDGWRDFSSGQLGNVFAKVGRQQDDSKWDLSLLVGRSSLLGNGLLPSQDYGTAGANSPTANLYENNRRTVYTHPDQTKNELNQLTFNLQRMLDDETELAGLAYLRFSTRKAYSGDVQREETVSGLGLYQNEGALNLNSNTQTSFGGSINLTKVLARHQITTGVSADLAQMKYGAEHAQNCDITAFRGIENCDPAEKNAGVRGNSYAIGLYASDTWDFSERSFLTGAARFNHANVRNTIISYTGGVGTDQPRESHNYNSFNPSLGISYRLTPVMNVFTNIGQSNRVPTIIELGCADKNNPCSLPTGLQADPYLRQVIARTFEAGTRLRPSEKSEFTFVFYRTDNSDDILFRPTAPTGGRGYFTNFSRTRRQGLDVSARTQIGIVSLQASYNYLHATYQADGELFGGERNITVGRGTKISGLPDHTLRLNAELKASSQLTLGSSILATSGMVTQGNEDGLIGDGESVNTKVDGYLLLNLYANYQSQKNLEYFARLNNVFDTRYETYGMMALSAFDQSGADNLLNTSGGQVSRFVAPGAPRNFMVGLRYRF